MDNSFVSVCESAIADRICGAGVAGGFCISADVLVPAARVLDAGGSSCETREGWNAPSPTECRLEALVMISA
jgi:hypothetical protein